MRRELWIRLMHKFDGLMLQNEALAPLRLTSVKVEGDNINIQASFSNARGLPLHKRTRLALQFWKAIS